MGETERSGLKEKITNSEIVNLAKINTIIPFFFLFFVSFQPQGYTLACLVEWNNSVKETGNIFFFN